MPVTGAQSKQTETGCAPGATSLAGPANAMNSSPFSASAFMVATKPCAAPDVTNIFSAPILKPNFASIYEDIISKEEYQIFRKNYLEQITKLNENIEYRRNKQEVAKERIKNNEKWLIDIKKYKALTKPDRLSVVMLIDKILIGDDKEIEVIFNHQEEVAFLEAMANSREEKTVRKFVESEVCYG